MNVFKMVSMTCVALAFSLGVFGFTARSGASFAFEDAAYQAATQMGADQKVTASVKKIALARIFGDPGKALSLSSDEVVAVETALASVPGKLQFVAHSANEDVWKAIDEIFRQARDMSSWDPKTLTKLNRLQLCDAILVGNILPSDTRVTSGHELSVRIAFRLYKVETSELLWSSMITGSYSDGGPENETVSLNWRRALESCAADAVAKLPPQLEGYGLLMLPIEGKSGTAMAQVFLNALTAAGKQDKIKVYDLPKGNVQDRMFAKFLKERAAKASDDPAFVRQMVGQYAMAKKLPEKLAIMNGFVSVVNENPKFELDARGLPVDFLGGAQAAAAQERKSYEIITDFKFRDVNDSFRIIASVGANGVYAPPQAPQTWSDKVQKDVDGFSRILNSPLGTVVIILFSLFAACFVLKKLIRSASRPR